MLGGGLFILTARGGVGGALGVVEVGERWDAIGSRDERNIERYSTVGYGDGDCGRGGRDGPRRPWGTGK